MANKVNKNNCEIEKVRLIYFYIQNDFVQGLFQFA